MSREDIMNLRPKRGIDIVLTPTHTNSNIYIATISATDLNPSNPEEECQMDDLDEFINEKLNIYSDRIRDPKDLAKIPKVAHQMAMNINDKRLDDPKYDILRKKPLQTLKKSDVSSLEGRTLQMDTLEHPENFQTVQEG